MIKAAIDRILDLGKADIVTVDDRVYTTKALHPVEGPSVTTMTIHTLTGIVDYINDKVDDLEKPLFIHIESATVVKLYSYLEGQFPRRKEYLSAAFLGETFKFGRFMDLEPFIIALQSQFVQTDTRAVLLKFVGNVVGENVMTFADDGVSQSVAGRVGISSVSEMNVPNPVSLIPYRTFPEVDQPVSEFVFRLKNHDGQPPQCGLFAADGGYWQNDAIQSIKNWLVDQELKIPIIA